MEPLTPLRELARDVARVQDEAIAVDASPEQRARAKFLAAARQPSPPARRPWLLVATGAGAAVAAFLAVVLWPRPIVMENGASGAWLASAEDYLSAAGPADVPLRFSDGSHIELRSGARARLTQRTQRGATLILEHGHLAAAVVHRPDTEWKMRAGPFEVRITGTRFELEWSAEQGVLTLDHLEGSVVVSGCQPESLKLSTGQVLHAACTDGRLQLTSTPPVAAPAPPTAPAPPPLPTTPELLAPLAPPVAEATPRPAIAPPTPPPPPPVPPILLPDVPLEWRELARTGRLAEAWVAAEERGLLKESQSASAAELLLLADCARVAGNHAWERQMFYALRERFPHTPHAAIAAYGIGRVTADARVDYVEADRWFAAALAEQPQGPLAGEAMGRLLELRKLRNDNAGAREIAFEYLARFPQGPYAGLAQSLVEEGR